MERSKICDLEFTNLSGERLRIKLKDMDARCAQHEMDHLNGILITTGETPDEME
jgi:peptide deformylase